MFALARSDYMFSTECAEAGARLLGFSVERRLVGLGELAPAIAAFGRAA